MKQVFTPNAKNILFIAVFCLSATVGFASNSNSNFPADLTAKSIEVNTSEKWVSFKWIATIQANFNHFEVERSFDNNNFKSIGLVLDGFETAEANSKSFMFRDQRSALNGQTAVYYRMKQVNADGTIVYSEVITVKL